MSVATSTKQNAEAAIQNLISSFETAWNKHDASAMSSLFAEDSDLISPDGRAANGRQEIERLFENEQSTRFRTSRMDIKVNRIRNLTPEVAVVTDDCELSGVQDANGQRTIKAITTFVLQNERGNWRIVSARPMIPVAPSR